jgi:hypothetical protein
MAILHPASDQEKIDALRQAANGPVLFRRLNEQFDGQRPSETNLRSWLLRNGFSKSAVDSVIKAYGETMDLVGDSTQDYKSPDKMIEPQTGHLRLRGGTPEVRQVATIAPSEPFSVEMLKGRVRVVGELSNKEDAQTLLDFLKSAVAFLPAKASEKFIAEDGSQAPDWDEDDDL